MEINEKYQVIINKGEFDYLMKLKDSYHNKIKEIRSDLEQQFLDKNKVVYEVRVEDIRFRSFDSRDIYMNISGELVDAAYGYYRREKEDFDRVYLYTSDSKEVFDELNERYDNNVRELQKAVNELNKYVEKFGLIEEEREEEKRPEEKRKWYQKLLYKKR